MLTGCGEILDRLQRMGVMQIEQVDCGEMFSNPDTLQLRHTFEQTAASIRTAIDALDSCAPKKSGLLDSFKPRPELGQKDYSDLLESSDKLLRRCAHITKCRRSIDELKAEIARSEMKIDQLASWLPLDIPMDSRGTSSSSVLIGYMPGQFTREDILTHIALEDEELDAYDVEIISSSAVMTCIFCVCLKPLRKRLEAALHTLGFSRPVETCSLSPREQVERIKVDIAAANEQIDKLSEKLAGYAESRTNLEYLLDYYEIRLDKYRAFDSLSCSKSAFVLEGWLPESKCDDVIGKLEESDAFCELIEPEPDEAPPVLLRNGPITEGGEPILQMYSMPSKNDIDPTGVMSIFYYLLFGIMLGDAAYGLIMIAATAFVLLRFKPEPAKRKTMKLFMFSGFAATIWGFLFGSFFGDLPNVIAHTFFGVAQDVAVFKPIWFDPITNPMQMMYFSIAFGGVHVLTGLLMGVITAAKNRDYVAAVCDYASWLVLLLSVIGWALLTMFALPLPFTIPSIVPNILLTLAALCVLTILVMNGRSSRSIPKRLLKGAYALYGITSYLSDFMSYSRLLALGLATGVISQVFNQMGSMVSGAGGIVGIILMIVVCIIGHAFNIGISLIGCYVHSCRLQYVEFLGKFYEGGGREFAPLGANTRFFKFKEEN